MDMDNCFIGFIKSAYLSGFFSMNSIKATEVSVTCSSYRSLGTEGDKGVGVSPLLSTRHILS